MLDDDDAKSENSTDFASRSANIMSLECRFRAQGHVDTQTHSVHRRLGVELILGCERQRPFLLRISPARGYSCSFHHLPSIIKVSFVVGWLFRKLIKLIRSTPLF